MNRKNFQLSEVPKKLSGLYDAYDNHDFRITRDSFSHGRSLAYIVFFAFLLRLLMGSSYTSSYDTEWNILWGVQLKDGFFSAYMHVTQLDYPPLYLYPLYIIGRIVSNPVYGGYPPFRMLAIKFVPCFCDCMTCVVLFLLGRRKNKNVGLFAAALWAVNPASIVNCACWGQTDCVLMFLAALLMLALEEKHVVAAGILWAVMCSTKLQGLYLTPVVGMEVLTICFGSLHPKIFKISKAVKDRHAVMRFVRFVFAAGVTLTVIYLPFMLGSAFSHCQPQMTWWEKFLKPVTVYSEGLDKYPFCTLNGDNIYMIFGLNGVRDDLQWLTGLSVAAVGKIFLLGSIAAVVAIYLFGRRRSHWLTGFLFMECVFLLTCRQHERYQIVALVLLMGAFVQLADKRLLTCFGLNSMVIFFNQFRILASVREKSGWWKYYKYGGGSAEWMNRRSDFAFMNSVINLLLFAAALVFVIRFFATKKKNNAIGGDLH